MLKKSVLLFVLGLLLLTWVTYSYAQCNADKQIKEQKVACCQCCCCNCAK